MIKKLTFIIILILGLIACSQNFYNERLMKAIENNDIKQVSSILKKQKADINHISEVEGFNNFTPLIFASDKGNYEIVKLLIDNGADINAKDNNGHIALIEAVDSGNYEKIVKLLVENGADIDAKDNDGRIALIEAVDSGNYEIVKLLIDNGADINAKDNNGRIALIEAVDSFHFQNKLGRIGLIEAVDSGNYEKIVKLLVENGADIDAKGDVGIVTYRYIKGYTALMLASGSKNLRAVKYLVRNGADINTKSDSGITALMVASSNDDLESVKYLVENGADINAKDNDGNTVLMIYYIDGYPYHDGNKVELVESPIDFDDFSMEEMRKQDKIDLEVVKYLVENGANINAKNNMA